MGENNVKEIKCSSVEDFIKKISYKGILYKLNNNNYIYRGESSDQYKLIPSALREQNHKNLVNLVKNSLKPYPYINENSENFQMIAEYLCLYQFYIYSDYRGLDLPNINNFRDKVVGNVNIIPILESYSTWLPLNYIEVAGLAQHYGVNTRLLDWSRDINVAIYFAVSGLMKFEASEIPENIVLWVLDTSAFKAPEENSTGIVLYTPKYAGNPNLCAQKGAFSLFRFKNEYKGFNKDSFNVDYKIVKPFDDMIKEINNTDNKKPILYKILIPTPQDKELYNYLSKQGYEASLIFPGYEGVTKKIKDDLYWKNQKLKHK